MLRIIFVNPHSAGGVSYSLSFDNFILLQICLQSPIFISPFSSKPFQSFPINRDKRLTQTHTNSLTQAHTQTSTHPHRLKPTLSCTVGCSHVFAWTTGLQDSKLRLYPRGLYQNSTDRLAGVNPVKPRSFASFQTIITRAKCTATSMAKIFWFNVLLYEIICSFHNSSKYCVFPLNRRFYKSICNFHNSSQYLCFKPCFHS